MASEMGFDEYQEASGRTADYPVLGYGFVYPSMGFAGEAGEDREEQQTTWPRQNSRGPSHTST